MRLGPRPAIWVFAVEDTIIQLNWRGLAAGELRLAVDGTDVALDLQVAAGPGVALLDDLPPGRDLTIRASGSALSAAPGSSEPVVLAARTLERLPGEELTRIATVSDLHLGMQAFGHQGTIRETPVPEVLHPERCAEAAFADVASWGAERLLVKGDITNKGQVDEWRAYSTLVRAAPFPVDALPGNHDRGYRPMQPGLLPEDAALAFDLSMALPVLIRDLPGLRIVLIDSTTAPGRNRGQVASWTAEVIEAAHDADPAGSVLVALHHQLQPHHVAEGWPLGVHHLDSRALLEQLGAVHPRVLVTSGHTHRHRRWDHGGVTATQVGSTKDYPGVWAGYVAHEGGIRQVVRRVSPPDCLAWTDQTRRAALGSWRWVAPGLLSSRCFNLTGQGITR